MTIGHDSGNWIRNPIKNQWGIYEIWSVAIHWEKKYLFEGVSLLDESKQKMGKLKKLPRDLFNDILSQKNHQAKK